MGNRPKGQKKCWQCGFLQTRDVLQLYISSCLISSLFYDNGALMVSLILGQKQQTLD